MRRVLSLLFAGALVLLGSAAQAQAQIINCTGNMSGGNENPPLISGSGGPVTVTMDVAAGTIQYLVDSVQLSLWPHRGTHSRWGARASTDRW